MKSSRWLLASVALLSGCTGVFNPYVKPVRDNGHLFVTSKKSDGATDKQNQGSSACDNLDDDLCEALKLAEGYRVAYLNAAGNQQRLRNGAAIVGLAAAASTLYYGMQGRDIFKDRVLRLGTLGATAYAGGTYFSSSPRQQVYLHGATAMSCAIIAAAPHMIPKDDRASLKRDLDTLHSHLAAARENYKGDSSAEVLETFSQAENVLRDGRAMYAGLLRSGMVLRQRIEVLANEVNKQALAQLPDLASMYSLAGAMAGYAKGFGAERLTTPAPAPAAAKARALLETARPAEISLDDVKIATNDVQRHLQFADAAAQSFDEVGLCNPLAVGSPFAVEPAGDAASVEKGKTLQFIVTDSGHPSAKLSGTNTELVELQPVQAAEDNASKYRVVVKGLDVTGQKGPQLTIRDSTGVRFHSVTITVSAAAPATTSTTTTTGTTSTTSAALAANAAAQAEARTARNVDIEPAVLKDPLKILAVQCVVNAATKDCIMGLKTRAAIRAYRRTAKDDSIDAALQAEADKLRLDPAACSRTPVTCNGTP